MRRIKFEKLCLKPINILRWLEHEGYIDRKTGKGQEKFVKRVMSLILTSTSGCRLVLKGQRLSLQVGLSILQNMECALHIVFNAETGEYLGKTTQVLYE